MTWLRDNGLTIALVGLFAISLAGQVWAGWAYATEEAARHGEQAPAFWTYVFSGESLSAVFENWESEFLQMAAYVVLTAHLFQRGSAESRDPDDPSRENDEKRRGGLIEALYAHSLGIALGLLFVASFALHFFNSARAAAGEAARHGAEPPTLLAYVSDAQFWFESFQNWQSEFFSVAVLVVLSIFLRERHSPESKPVWAPHGQTGAG